MTGCRRRPRCGLRDERAAQHAADAILTSSRSASFSARRLRESSSLAHEHALEEGLGGSPRASPNVRSWNGGTAGEAPLQASPSVMTRDPTFATTLLGGTRALLGARLRVAAGADQVADRTLIILRRRGAGTSNATASAAVIVPRRGPVKPRRGRAARRAPGPAARRARPRGRATRGLRPCARDAGMGLARLRRRREFPAFLQRGPPRPTNAYASGLKPYASCSRRTPSISSALASKSFGGGLTLRIDASGSPRVEQRLNPRQHVDGRQLALAAPRTLRRELVEQALAPARRSTVGGARPAPRSKSLKWRAARRFATTSGLPLRPPSPRAGSASAAGAEGFALRPGTPLLLRSKPDSARLALAQSRNSLSMEARRGPSGRQEHHASAVAPQATSQTGQVARKNPTTSSRRPRAARRAASRLPTSRAFSRSISARSRRRAGRPRRGGGGDA